VSFPLRPASPATRWFRKRHRSPTPAQAAAWPLLAEGRNVLIVSPTGTGKTLAAFLAVLHELSMAHAKGRLPDAIQAIYISPLRALSYDLEKNLREPLEAMYGPQAPIRVGLRSGDTPATERRRHWAQPPHLLLTTPESLLILLSQERWISRLREARWVIVDEVHALAESKRGAHLSLSLERLEALRPENSPLQRVGLTATVAPLPEVASFLVGAGRSCEIVDVAPDKKIRIEVYSPLSDHPYPPAGFTGVRLIGELAELIRQRRTTLVFSNTRSGAEAATYWLKEALPDLADAIECHHASLDRDVRIEVEDRLKRGELRAVVCSTSLELGIDIGAIDLVVMLATPKGVTKALQRAGRAGHNPASVSQGLLMATNLNDLVECCATARLARRRRLEDVRLPRAPLDVLAQHLVSMGCVGRWSRDAAFQLVRRAYPYRDLPQDEFNEVLDYLAGGGESLRRQYTELFGKIVLDEDAFETRPGRVQRDFLQNAGVIPSEGSVIVRLRMRRLGAVEEGFMRHLRPGDVFMLAGRPVRLLRTAVLEAFVERADGALPTVPRWNANKMPLSNRVADEIASFRGELRERFAASADDDPRVVEWIAERLECGMANARVIHRTYRAQQAISEIPTADFLLIEELATTGFDLGQVSPAARETEARGRAGSMKRREALRRIQTLRAARAARHYFFHALIGRAANDALSRVVALRLARLRGGNAIATPDDYGFVLTVAPEQAIQVSDLEVLLHPDGLEADLQKSLDRSELLKHHFRNAAQTGLMVYRNYFGEQKPARKVQWSAEVIFHVLSQHEPNHILLREARRDAVHTYLDVDAAAAFLQRALHQPRRLRVVPRVPPLSFGMYATKIREALLVEDPRETMERLFHLWWNEMNAKAPPPGSSS
jgi:ATP-dependent Lhr-like helicase